MRVFFIFWTFSAGGVTAILVNTNNIHQYIYVLKLRRRYKPFEYSVSVFNRYVIGAEMSKVCSFFS